MNRRRWYIAAILSLIVPGLGQFYNARLRRGGIIAAVLVALTAAQFVLISSLAVSLAIFGASAVITLLLIALYLFAIIDAAVFALRHRMAVMGRFNRAWAYFSVIIVCILGQSLAAPEIQIASYNIPAGSMHPTVLVGDYLIADKGYFLRQPPLRGDLAIFKLPVDNRTDYIKRVVGLPGDSIRLIGGKLYINERPIPRERIEDWTGRRGTIPTSVMQYIEAMPGGPSYRIIEERGDDGMLDNTPPYRVPDGHYFVLGDNRDSSQDSRILSEVGFIPLQNFRDRPAFIFWSADLSRIGRPLR